MAPCLLFCVFPHRCYTGSVLIRAGSGQEVHIPSLFVLHRRDEVLFAVWAATTTNNDYIRMQGLKRVVNDAPHRNEVVAGHMAEHLTAGKRAIFCFRIPDKIFLEYREVLKHMPDESGDFYEALGVYRKQDRLSFFSMLQEPLRELPQVSRDGINSGIIYH
jgi:hypothetical protein